MYPAPQSVLKNFIRAVRKISFNVSKKFFQHKFIPVGKKQTLLSLKFFCDKLTAH